MRKYLAFHIALDPNNRIYANLVNAVVKNVLRSFSGEGGEGGDQGEEESGSIGFEALEKQLCEFLRETSHNKEYLLTTTYPSSEVTDVALRGLRVKYLLNEIDKDYLRVHTQRLEKKIEKNMEVRTFLIFYFATVHEIMIRFIHHLTESAQNGQCVSNDILKELTELIAHVNSQFTKVSGEFQGNKTPHFFIGHKLASFINPPPRDGSCNSSSSSRP